MELNEEQENSEEMKELHKKREELLKQYNKAKSIQKRRFLEQLISINIELKEYEVALEYLEEYKESAAEDAYAYIYNYEINKGLGQGIDKLIEILEQLKESEYMEKWGYELAHLYYEADETEKCKKECKELILWFGEGKYVDKAKKLLGFFGDSADESILQQESSELLQQEPLEYNNKIEQDIIKQMEFAIEYIKSKDYTLNNEGKEILKEKLIKEYRTDLDEVTQSMKIVEIVKKAIQNSEKRCMKKLAKVVQERKYMESGFLELRKTDFN